MRRAFLVLALVAVGFVTVPPPAQAATHNVNVDDSGFGPEFLEIEPGDTVVWSALRTGHTVTADDGRFDFHRDRVLGVGEQVSWTFDAEEDVRFYCKLHGGPGGQGMSGLIRVGDPPRPPVVEAPSLVVPDDSPTIAAAASGALPGTEILVRPGVYTEEVVASVPGVVIRGLGASADEVVLTGEDARDVGVTVGARGVRVENLTITGFRNAGIAVGPVTGTVVQDTSFMRNGLYGVDARSPAGLTVRDSHFTGHGVAGIGVRDCQTCGARIDGGRFETNAAGIVTASATGVVIRGADVSGNAVGVVLRGVVGAQVIGNTVTDNDSTDVWVAGASAGPEPPTGAGIWISGGRNNLVASNTVTGHTYNVAVTGPLPSLDHRIVDNSVGDALHADLAWDGIGAGVCFSGNKSLAGGDATTDPPWMAQLYNCDTPAAGVPYPIVTANLARHAQTGGYPI